MTAERKRFELRPYGRPGLFEVYEVGTGEALANGFEEDLGRAIVRHLNERVVARERGAA